LELEEEQIAQYDTNRYHHPSDLIGSNSDDLRPTAGRTGEESNANTIVPLNLHSQDDSGSSGRNVVNEQNGKFE
jgi:hypothetical protein